MNMTMHVEHEGAYFTGLVDMISVLMNGGKPAFRLPDDTVLALTLAGGQSGPPYVESVQEVPAGEDLDTYTVTDAQVSQDQETAASLARKP